MEQSNNKNPGQDGSQDGESEAHKQAAADPAGAPGAAEAAVAGNASAAPGRAASDAMKALPVVEAPSLDAAKAAEPVAEPAAAPPPQPAEPITRIVRQAADKIADDAAAMAFAVVPQTRASRFAVLAATIAVAAGLGSFVGVLAASGIVHHDVADAAMSRDADVRNTLQVLNKELAELNALKASFDTANRNAGAQFARITDRLVSLERVQADSAAKLARPVPEITGSIGKPAALAPEAMPAPTASETILNTWIVRAVRNGRALVENRYGGVFVAFAGGSLPGLGRVEAVRRQDGGWIVVTAKGTITSYR